MRIFKTRHFAKWADKHKVDDALLIAAVYDLAIGLVDADYGGFLYKKRIATKGRGKSGSVRTLLAVQISNKAYFLYGFEKNEQANITLKEKAAYKLLAKSMLGFTTKNINERLKEGSLLEVKYE